MGVVGGGSWWRELVGRVGGWVGRGPGVEWGRGLSEGGVEGVNSHPYLQCQSLVSG